MILIRKVIVAIYVQHVSIVLPVNPVGHVEKPAPHSKRQQQTRQNSPSFAALLDSLMQEDREEASEFHALV